jgi:hypothetical protein
MPKLKRRHHFLPECYQKAFVNDSGRVWVKFADRPRPEIRNPDSVGRQRSFYIRTQNGKEDDKIEDFFAKEVESHFTALSQRIKNERNEFSEISENELGVLARFMASQIVRTMGHKQTIEEQAGFPVDKGTFLRVMLRKLWALMDDWIRNRPQFYFYTSLPHVGDRFITGDNPVLILQINDNKIWTPTDEPRLQITDLANILQHPNHQFWMPLSPYVCVSVRGHWQELPNLPPRTMDPQEVRLFNSQVRGQCKLFTIARDKESLT